MQKHLMSRPRGQSALLPVQQTDPSWMLVQRLAMETKQWPATVGTTKVTILFMTRESYFMASYCKRSHCHKCCNHSGMDEFARISGNVMLHR